MGQQLWSEVRTEVSFITLLISKGKRASKERQPNYTHQGRNRLIQDLHV